MRQAWPSASTEDKMNVRAEAEKPLKLRHMIGSKLEW